MSELRYAVLTEFGAWSASTRYRALQALPLLRDRLGHVDVFLADDRPPRRPGPAGRVQYFGSHVSRYVRRCSEVRRTLPHYDAVLVQRGLYPLGPSAVAAALDRFPGRVVYDLDDGVFDLDPDLERKGRAARWLYGPQQARRILRRADAVIVSTEVLAASLPRTSAAVHVLPTVPDPAPYAVSDHSSVGHRVVWAGTTGGLGYLDPLREVFAALQDQQIGKLVVVCSEPWSGPAEFRAWRQEDEPTMFADYAVGIMPLTDTAYTRAKAGFKLLQYMAAGLPVVASPVGVNRELVERSGAGLLATTPEEWREALTKLLTNAALRAELGAAGRAFVTAYADLNAQADLLAALLQDRSDKS